MRIAIIKNMIAPYTTPLFEELGRRHDVELLVVYETAMEANRQWIPAVGSSYKSVVLSSVTVRGGKLARDSYVHVPMRPLAGLVSFKPDVIVASGGVWSSPVNIAALVARRRYNWAIVPWWGEFRSGRRPSLRWLTGGLRRWLLTSADAVLSYSDRATANAIDLGADPSRVVHAPNVARLAVRPPSPEMRPHSDGPRLLYVGQLTERKGIRTLLDAFRLFGAGQLWIAGDGLLRNLVAQHAASDSRIRLLGHLSDRELDEVYDRVDALVLPSLYETWGLVVNEALAHGLPIVASNEVAAADHLIEHDLTGYVLPAGSAPAFADAFRKIGSSWDVRAFEDCGKRAAEVLKTWNYSRAADAVLLACRKGIQHRAHFQSEVRDDWQDRV